MAARIKNSIVNSIRWLAVAAVFMSFSAPMLADQFDDQINELKRQIGANQGQIQQLQAQKDTLENKLATLNAQIADTTARLALNRAEYAKVSAELAAAEVELARKKAILGEAIRAIYLETNLTPIEVLASSGNFSEFVDKQQYLQSLKTSVEEAITEVNALKATLQERKDQQALLISEQETLRAGLSRQRAETNSLIIATNGQEAAYQAKVAEDSAKIAQLRAQQAAAIAEASRRAGGHSGSSGGACDAGQGNGGYPSNWCNASFVSYIPDSWGMYLRQCVSYTAWRVHNDYLLGKNTRDMPYWGGRGNANEWPGNADRAGIPRNNIPQVGAVAIYMGGPYGHAMIVEQVKSSTVIVSNMNANWDGKFSLDEWPISSLTFIHF